MVFIETPLHGYDLGDEVDAYFVLPSETSGSDSGRITLYMRKLDS